MTDAPDPEVLRDRLRALIGKPVRDLDFEHRHKSVSRVVKPIRTAANGLWEVLLWRGLDTSDGRVELEHFHPDRVTYQPSGWLYLRRGLRRREVGPDDVFVDFGSGKGRVLCQAARRYPFKRVIGIEISEALTQIARANVEHSRDKFGNTQVELVTGDVVDLPIPEDLSVAYFYHPFAGKTFEAVIDRLVDSIDRVPRRVRIIYACPGLESYILATGRFRPVRSSRGGFRNFLYRRVAVYLHDPHDDIRETERNG